MAQRAPRSSASAPQVIRAPASPRLMLDRIHVCHPIPAPNEPAVSAAVVMALVNATSTRNVAPRAAGTTPLEVRLIG